MNTIDNNMRLGGYAGFDLGSIAEQGRTEASADKADGLTVGLAPASSLDDLEAVPAEWDAALTRDDDLGQCMNAVFNLPAPPMPDFT